MTNQHPITPPPELVEEWWGDKPRGTSIARLATQAAQWGADQQLEATDTWIRTEIKGRLRPANRIADDHRADMRSKPPSLKEQAIDALERVDGYPDDIQRIFRALEALD
jgi:hypothetical protein